MLEIKYKDRPSSEVVERYYKKIEDFLSAHGVKVRLDIFDTPWVMKSFVNNEHVKDEYVWIKSAIAEMPDGKQIIIGPAPRFGFDEKISDREIWDDAWCIQNAIYRERKIVVCPDDMSDPYWNLWNKLRK